MKWTAKTKAVVGAALTGLVAFINVLAQAPPEVQSGWYGDLVNLFDISVRPNVILFTGFLKWALGIYSFYYAAHSGPQTPPKNPAN